MPNGHGGIPRFGSPVLLAIAFAALWFHYTGNPAAWSHGALLVIAALFGLRMSWHLHMWRASEYGGAMVTAEELRKAYVAYILGAGLYALASVGLAWLLVPAPPD